jgi:hypothetical protein
MNRRDRIEELNSEILSTRASLLALKAERDALEVDAPTVTRKHPIQRVAPDAHGTVRFVQNPIVSFLLDQYTPGLNGLADLSANKDFSSEDWEQLAQLIGYSVDGFSTLSYVSDETMAEADAAVALLAKKEPTE